MSRPHLCSLFCSLFAVCLLLVACQSDQGNDDDTTVIITGDAVDSTMPMQIEHDRGVAYLTDILLNDFADKNPGVSIDDADRRHAISTEQRAYNTPLGETIEWINSQNGDMGTIEPVRDGYVASGSYCREFEQTITIGVLRQQSYGKACRQPDGPWKIAP